MIQNILFDLGGVILDIDYNKTEIAFKKLGFEDFDAVYSQAKQSTIFDSFETGNMDEIDFFKTFSNQSNISNSDIHSAWCSMLGPIAPLKIKFLNSIKSSFHLALLSNTNKTHLDSFRKTMIRDHGKDVLKDIFVKTYYSHELGLRKPHPDTFIKVLEDLKWKASETLFIDDSIQHIEGASMIGLKTVLFEQNGPLNLEFLDKALSKHH